jgi:steroid Delta-isomerase
MEAITMNSNHAYIHREWHRAASKRDTTALIALYAEDAILESPLVPAVVDGKSDGVLRGKAEIGRFFEAGARSRPIDLIRWHRSDIYFSAGATLIWEYPRVTPEGDQIEIVEVMEIADRLIHYHRIYWGWKGCLLIAPRLAKA